MKRWMLRILVFLLLGAIVNVAVAWAGNVEEMQRGSRARPGGGYFAPNDAWIEYTRSDALMCTTLEWSSGRRHPALEAARRKRLRDAPYWSVVASLPSYTSARPGESPNPGAYRERGSGFPLVSMVLYGRYNMSVVEYVTPVIRLPARQLQVYGMPYSVERILPLRPTWPGFAMNTVFYAALLWLLFAAPFALRRHLRIKRGLCVRCAYPIGTSEVCTECGAAVSPKVVAS